MQQTFSNPFVLCGAVLLVIFALIMPVSATFQIQQSAINPSQIPLQQGAKQSVNAVIAIIPQGATTFIPDYQLQLTTDLVASQWDVQVMVNGRPAAVIPVTGSTAFINGFLLSYPNNNDVAVNVAVTGIVPPGVSGVNLLQVIEQNNAGQTVPGSVQTISEPVAIPATPVMTAPPAPVMTTATPPPTKAPGLSPVILIGGLVIGALAVCIVKKE
ncbi:MAG: hypothetical protein NTV68_03090 [Methanomicrobiales archaeon]|nr:hypothetical protein [Methanomicrobiales archaeon]